jgi:CO/xanthine dehydrogenase FAD-binding subunit
MGGVAKTPFRLKKTEEVIKGKKFTPEVIEKAGLVASEEIQPRSRRSSAFYKREVTKILIRDAMSLSWKRAENTDQAYGIRFK